MNDKAKYKVESGIPIPDKDIGRHSVFPFKAMDVGDSFAVENEQLNNARASASWDGKRNGRKFSVRKTATGYRCWRIA